MSASNLLSFQMADNGRFSDFSDYCLLPAGGSRGALLLPWRSARQRSPLRESMTPSLQKRANEYCPLLSGGTIVIKNRVAAAATAHHEVHRARILHSEFPDHTALMLPKAG